MIIKKYELLIAIASNIIEIKNNEIGIIFLRL
jgi:hypothetical protein